jgi:hypothetical protein
LQRSVDRCEVKLLRIKAATHPLQPGAMLGVAAVMDGLRKLLVTPDAPDILRWTGALAR